MPEGGSQYKRQPIKYICTGVNITTPSDLLPDGKYIRLENVRPYEEAGAIQCRPGIEILNAVALGNVGTGATEVHSIRRLNDNIGSASDGIPTSDYITGVSTFVYQVNTNGGSFGIAMNDRTAAPWTFSGRPVSLTPWRPTNSPRTWMYVWDTVQLIKFGRDNELPTALFKAQQTGITSPNNPAAATGGGGSYFYRYRYRSTLTGATSNPSPVTFVGAAATGCTVTSSPDPQVDIIDIYRFGGALLEYFFVGTVVNGVYPASVTFVDTVNDSDAQENEILDEDHDQPFTVAGLPISGTCTIAPHANTTTLTWVSGSLFQDQINAGLELAPGTIVNVNGTDYILYRRPLAPTVIEVIGVVPSIPTNVWRIDKPTLLAKPLPFAWGPFQNVLMAVGDYFNPGTLYWTNPNDPDTASSLNAQEVTPPTEPLMNGFTHDGKCYVFSNARLFGIYPNFTGVNTWEILETPCQRGLYSNWAFCTTGEKQGGGEIYFLSYDGIYMTRGGEAVSLTDQDLFHLFPHEGIPGEPSNELIGNYLPVDMTQRNYLRLSHSSGYVYFDYKDTGGTLRTLVYDTRIKGWIFDTYTPNLRLHYNDEGREVSETIGTANNGHIYLFTNNGNDDGTAIPCRVRTGMENYDEPGAKKLLGQIVVDCNPKDQAITFTPLLDNEIEQAGFVQVIGPYNSRLQSILDINAGEGKLCYSVGLDAQWSNTGNRSILFMWEPSVAPKPEDTQKRAIEWHEFIAGGNDAYVTGVVLWIDTRDLNDVAQTKTIGIWSDQVNTGNSFNISSNGEQKIELSWPVFKGKLGRILPTDLNRCRILKWEWQCQAEPLLISKWDTNWTPLGERTSIAYLTGCVIVADTIGISKAITFQSEFEGTISVLLAAGGNTFQSNGRTTKSYSFTPLRAEQVRFYSYDEVLGRLYTWEWAVHYVEPRFLANWDSKYEWFPEERLIKGIRIDADTINQAKSINVELDGVVYTTLSCTHDGRRAIHYDMPIDPATGEFPRARMARIMPTDTVAAFMYDIKWIADPEPPRLANWNAKWEDGGELGAKYLQGFVLDADTGGTDKSVIVEYYPEPQSSAISTAQTFAVNHTGRGGKAYSLNVPVVAHKFRLRPLDTNQNWLYNVKWVFEPHPEMVKHWETQGYAHGLPGYQHRREAYIAYEAFVPIYWTQVIDGQSYTIQLPSTGGAYRKVYTPCLPLKGKLFKDIFDTDPPASGIITYVASLSDVEAAFTDGTVDIVTGGAALNAADPSIEVT